MTEKAGEKATAAAKTAAGAFSSAGEKVSRTATAASGKLSDAAHTAGRKLAGGQKAAGRYAIQGKRAMKHRVSDIEVRFRQASDEYPIAVGGIFLAAGLLTGLLLPRTEREDEWLGQASDQLKEQTREQVESIAERGKSAAAKTASSAMEEAEARGLTPGDLVEKASQVVSEAKKAGLDKAREEGISGSELKKHANAVSETAMTTAKTEGRKEAEKTSP